MVVGHARTEHVEEGESLVQDALLYKLRQMFLFAAEATGNKCRSSSQSQRDRIQGGFNVAEGHALCLHSHAAGGRGLACSKAVNLVIHDDVEQIDIAAHGV